MIHRYLGLTVLGALVALAGCEPPRGSSATAATPPPPPAGAVGIEFAEVPSGDAPASASTAAEFPVASQGPEVSQVPPPPGGQSTEPKTATPNQTTESREARESLPVHLSAGVALPQLLPEGTQIGVSVDYRVKGKLNSSRHVLVIQSAVETLTIPVELSSPGGTLQGFCPLSVRPEHKPFRARIEELSSSSGSQQTVSNTVDLATSYE